jgi:hypothetical protein
MMENMNVRRQQRFIRVKEIISMKLKEKVITVCKPENFKTGRRYRGIIPVISVLDTFSARLYA